MAGTDFGARDSAGVLMDADQVRALAELAGRAIADVENRGYATVTSSYELAEGVAQLAAEWEAQREALLDILEGRTLRTDKEKAREALSALAVSSSAPTTRKRRRSDGRSD
jgi:hypothetical protein